MPKNPDNKEEIICDLKNLKLSTALVLIREVGLALVKSVSGVLSLHPIFCP